jgi:flagellar FliL protein
MAEEEAVVEKKKSPLILFIIIGAVLVLLSVGGTFFVLSSMKDDGEEETVVEEVEETPKALYYAINPKFQTNYQVNGRQRLFQLAISLVTREQDVVDALALHSPSIKSKLLILLSGQDFKALQTPDGREALREQCLEAVREILTTEIGKPGVEKVLFTDFVVQ